jgi:DNA-binding NarL/FixJ family response regulator
VQPGKIIFQAAWTSGKAIPGLLLGLTNGASGVAVRVPRILIVEDDYFVAVELEHRLMQSGFHVIGTASTAEEAAEIAASERPELAIMDIRLAGLRDGVDAAIELLEHFGVPSIFATAHTDGEIRRRAERAKPLGWLEKPYSTEHLIKLVKTVLSSLPEKDAG